MSDERGVKAYFAWLSEIQRFDYYVAGATLALVGYLAANMPVGPMGLNGRSLEMLGLGVLLGAVYAGFKRIEASVTSLGAGSQKILAGEAAGANLDAFQKEGLSLRVNTGDLVDPAEALKQATLFKEKSSRAAQQEELWSKRAARWYRWRNRFLLWGLAMVIVARAIQAYGH